MDIKTKALLMVCGKHAIHVLVILVVLWVVKRWLDSFRSYLGLPPAYSTRLLRKDARAALFSIFKAERSARAEVLKEKNELASSDTKEEEKKIKAKYDNKIKQTRLKGKIDLLKAQESGDAIKKKAHLQKIKEKVASLKTQEEEEIKAVRLSKKDKLELLSAKYRHSIFRPVISFLYFLVTRNDKARFACHNAFPFVSLLSIEYKIINRKHALQELETGEQVPWEDTVSSYMESRSKYY